MSLRATHYGYTYQDLITGVALVDLLLGTAVAVRVDTKGFDADRFDDITISYRTGKRTRVQIKHTLQERELSKATFSSDGRSLKLNHLFDSLLSDLKAHPGTDYRVIVRDGNPDKDLAEVLRPIDAVPEVSDPFPGITTQKYKFNADRLRQCSPWKKLVDDLDDEQLRLACDQLTIDTSAPASSIDMTAPGPAELALLRRVTEELGAGRPPNTSRAPEDVALAFAYAATAARARTGDVTREAIAPRIGLTTDFGAVVEGHPVEKALAVTRTGAIATLRKHIDSAARDGQRIVLTGEPGVGKSWLCQQLAETYRAENWIVARHHCWLGATDIDRDKRVLTEVVVGSLLNQLEELAPKATVGLRPRFAATPEALEAALEACHMEHAEQGILLIIDGLDHVDRVLGRRNSKQPDPSRLLVDQLASIRLPRGTTVVIASQPGTHLANMEPIADQVQMPRLARAEVESLARRHRLIADTKSNRGNEATINDEHAIIDFLSDRSAGNALYATYLCRHASRVSPLDHGSATGSAPADILHRLRLVPPTATDLDAYYTHLVEDLTDGQEVAIGALALCDFALSADELAEMLPEAALFLVSALETLAPILNSQPGLGGLKVHHESFNRFILRDKPETWTRVIREKARVWLTGRGFFTDARAFRHLPELLACLDEYDDLKKLIGPGFVAAAIRTLQPPEALRSVVSTVARESEARLDWPVLVACVETRKAINTYESESLPNTLVQYAGVVASVVGSETVAERLLYEGRTTFPPRWGLRLCETIDRAGTAAPWSAYLEAMKREPGDDNTSYSSEEENALHLASQLGHLRLRDQKGGFEPDTADRFAAHFDEDHDVDLRDRVGIFTLASPTGTMPLAASKMSDPIKAAHVYLALADLAVAGTSGLPEPLELAREAWTRAPAADISGYIRHGISAKDVLAGLESTDLHDDLRRATLAAIRPDGAKHEVVQHWLSMLTLAHAFDPAVPVRILDLLEGTGFYRAWLRFAVATNGLAREVEQGMISPLKASQVVRVALQELASEARPFTGKPRACDLYFVHPLIHEVVENALHVVQPSDLEPVLDNLIAIGDGTTTSLMGMAGSGPLTTNDLLEVLSRGSETIGAQAIHSVLEVIRGRRNSHYTPYSMSADFELATARICVAAGAMAEADECWARASRLLAAYGGHKDPSLTEFLDTIQDLAAVDITDARASLAKLLQPAYLVRQHTDGRGTSHIPNSWWETAALVDPLATASDAAAILLAEPGLEDGRVQAAHEKLLETQIGKADPMVLVTLRLTAGMEWRAVGADVELLDGLKPDLGLSPQADAIIASVANNIAASYDDQPMMHAGQAPKSVATAELVAAVQELGGAAFHVRTELKENEEKEPSFDRRESSSIGRLLEGQQRPILPAGAAGAVVAARDYARKKYSDEPSAPRWHIDALTNAIGWRLVEVTAANGAQAGIQLLDDVAREIPSFSDNEIFAVIGKGLSARWATGKALDTVAAYCLTLAFIRIRARGGWQSFAGRERVELWKEAHALDPDTAEKTLAAGVGSAVSAGDMGLYGVTQGVIAALAAQPTGKQGGTAIECWNAAFDVLRERLPGDALCHHHVYSPTSGPHSESDLSTAIATLSIASITQPMRADLRRAILALALLITCRPKLAQAALTRVCAHVLDAGRMTWLLEVVRECLADGELTIDMENTLIDLAQSAKLSVRALAANVLEAHHRPVPVPPMTEPSASLRFSG